MRELELDKQRCMLEAAEADEVFEEPWGRPLTVLDEVQEEVQGEVLAQGEEEGPLIRSLTHKISEKPL